MRSACIAFVAGAWWLQQQTALVDGWLALLVAIAALLVVVLAAMVAKRIDAASARSAANSPEQTTRLPTAKRGVRYAASPRRIRRALATGALFVVGFTWATWRADLRLADSLSHALEGRDLVVVGTVAALPGSDAFGVRFPFTVESVVTRDAAGRPLHVPTHLALGWYRPRRGDAFDSDTVPDIRPGQRWRLTVRLKRPHGSANPGGFDYEYWLLEEGLRATGSVRPGADIDGDPSDDDAPGSEPATSTRKLNEFVWTAGHVVERIRAKLRDRVMTALADGRPIAESAPYAGVIVALIVGDQRAIAQSDWAVFNRTGIGHLVSISGLHVSMLAALGAWIAFAAWRRRPAWCARLPAHPVAAAAGVLVALVYCLLAGFGVPAQRTLYMIGVVAFALWTRRIGSVSRVLCIALAVVVALDPWAVTGSGFWLSFSAVAAIFYVTSGRLVIVADDETRRHRMWRTIRTAARVQWAVTLALTPLTLLFFNQVSLVSPIANAVAIPLVSFVVTPLSLAGAVLPTILGTWLLRAAHALVALLATGLQWLSATPIAVWSGPTPNGFAFVCAMVGVAWWLAPRGIPLRWTGALWMAPLFAWPPDRPAAQTVRITALDIGQGTAVLVETHGTNTLYDTGPTFSPENDAGSRIIAPFLRAHGIATLDTMVVSHNDNDHSGGALSVLKSVTVNEVYSSLAFDSPIVRASTRHVRCEAGQAWTVDGVRFDLLGPPADVYLPREGKALAKPNARSCVLRVAVQGRVALLTADIEKPQEAAIVERSRDALAADVLMVPHHGSRTSSTDAFIDAVHPSLAIVQAGYLNRFGHPRPDVLARYTARDIDVLRNDRDGAITVTLERDGITVDRYRASHRRYWYQP
jgi:competence protein ComEC